MEDAYTLLRAYTTQGDEKAFGECVARYLDLVYSAALRQVGGDASLAQDVTQLTTIRDAVEKLPKINADSNDLEALRQQQLELLRLRGKIAAQRRQETELQQKLAESESQADLANFQLKMLREGSTTHWAYQDRMYKERLAQMRQTWGGGAVTGIKGIQDNQHRLEARHGVPALAGGTAPKADFMKIFYRYRQCGSLAG